MTQDLIRIEFKLFDNITSSVSTYGDLHNTTIFFIECFYAQNNVIDTYAKTLLKSGCKSFVFHGTDAENWHYRFDFMDVDLYGDQDDIALTSTIDTLEDIPDELLICKENVIIYADSYKVLQQCRKIIVEADLSNVAILNGYE